MSPSRMIPVIVNITMCHYLLLLLYFSGDITQKGYDKKRQKLLAPYKPASQPPGMSVSLYHNYYTPVPISRVCKKY